jgi:hypothetical protein
MRPLRPAAALLAAALLPLGAAACTSSSTPAPRPAARPPATPSAAPPTASPGAGLLTGAQLKGLLEPPSYFPPGYRRQRAGTRDTGTGYERPSASDVRQPNCRLLGVTSWTSITGINGVSFAQNDYVDPASSTEIAQEIDVYPGTTARTVLRRLGAVSALCPSYTDPQTGRRAEVREQASPGLGEGGYVITVTDPAWRGGTTLVAARVGTAVVTVLSDGGGGNGRGSAVRLARGLVEMLQGMT